MATDRDLRHLTSEQIQAFLDEGLTPKESALVREHLSVCHACRVETEGWNLVFCELGALAELEPGPAFQRQVLAHLPVPEPVPVRVRRWLGARRGGVPLPRHLPEEGLQELLDGALSGRRAAGARAHLAVCPPCDDALKGWEGLFGSLAALGRFAPGEGFAGRIMARVRIPAPVPALWAEAGKRALGWARRLLPRTRRGWAVAGGIASAPTISVAALVYLVFSHPLLTGGTFATYASWKASALFSTVLSTLSSAVVESVALFRAYSLLGAMARSPFLVGAGGLAFSLMSAIALWVLYRNLVATPSVDRRYARARA